MESDGIEAARLDLARAQHALQERRVLAEIAAAEAKGELERRRFEAEAARPWYTANLPWLGPTLGALVALLTLMANQYFERESRERAARLESEALRFERESQIILQATDGVTPAQAVRNLEFYLGAGLIADPDDRIAAMVGAAEAPVTNPPPVEDPACPLEAAALPDALSVSDHWIEQAIRCPTPNTSGRELDGGAARYVVIDHTASGSLPSVLRWLRPPAGRASVHVVIGRDGSLVQMLPLNVVAWHAGRSEWQGLTGLNAHSIGIALVNWGELRAADDGTGWRAPTGVALTASEVIRVGASAWHAYQPAQIDTLGKVLAAVTAAYGIPADGVIGQADISPGRKTGPGPAFPWDTVRTRLAPE